ncbi:MAG TPA: lanthionine synthetase LanC family protein [Chitinophaga sp.]|uniref:lanthionine synthetase LanC family protein n=1 Tax=Chitinophaga sp. TaxID=1869181 RepID=UPI002CF1C162|nr:lanthionine synthetase LanC family protein [Chitinophaga sp.]HVI43860.1 lanthionine synthetase LanC family protein [Chitinophaga sp.]
MEIEDMLSGAITNDMSLLGGDTGISIFYYNLFKLTDEVQYWKKCQSLTNNLIDNFPGEGLDQTMGAGYTGIAWGLNFLQGRGIVDFEADYFFSSIDMHIYIQSLRSLMQRNYDYANGALGATVHALKRLPDEKAFGYLRQFVGALKGLQVVEEHNIRRKIDLPVDLAHSMANIVNCLTRIYNKDLFKDDIISLVNEYQTWLTVFCKEYQYWQDVWDHAADEKFNCSRHGKILRIAWSCLQAGQVFDNEIWGEEGMKLLQCAGDNYSIINTSDLNASFYNGSAGLAYLFHQLYKKTSLPVCLTNHNFWLSTTLVKAQYLNKDDGPVSKSHKWDNKYGILTGACGVGITLIDSLTTGLESWDECLLLGIS